jgi:hypothetical protein
MKLLLAFALALGLLAPIRASAAEAYMLNYIHYSPYSKTAVAGPFDTLSECMTVEAQQTYVSGGGYECDLFFYPG